MSDKLNIPDQTVLLAEIIIKVAAIERLLVKNKVLTSEDLTNEMTEISKEITHLMTSKGLDLTNQN
jgi:hypothetical protein